MKNVLTKTESNMYIYWLFNNTTLDNETIALLFDDKISDIITRYSSSRELLMKLKMQNPVIKFADGFELEYELDAEYYLGDSYKALFFGAWKNIKNIYDNLDALHGFGLSEDIILSFDDEKRNSFRRTRVYEYAKKYKENKKKYLEESARLIDIAENGVQDLNSMILNDLDTIGVGAAMAIIQYRINSAYRKIIDMVNSMETFPTSPDSNYWFDVLAEGFHKNKIDVDSYDFSTKAVVANKIKSREFYGWKAEFSPQELPMFMIVLPTHVSSYLSKTTRNRGITDQVLFNNDYTDYNIFNFFKVIQGIGDKSLAIIIKYRHDHARAVSIYNSRIENFKHISEWCKTKLPKMTIQEANVYLEEHFGSSSQKWDFKHI